MAIMVQYSNNTFGYVENRFLDVLIENDKIIAFRRGSGWAKIGLDPIRSPNQQAFEGFDRRALTEKRNCLTCADFVNSHCQSFECASRVSLQGKQVAMNSL